MSGSPTCTQMFSDSEVKGIFCLRGGYGAGQLLDDIDYDVVRKNPKIFVGYSDITALHLALNKFAGLVTFHGPVVLSDFTPYTQDCFRRALFGSEPLGVLANPVDAESRCGQRTTREPFATEVQPVVSSVATSR